MRPFRSLTAIAAPMPAANIDTDQIIPKQYLSTIERTGLGRGLFHDQRWDAQGNEKPDFLLNQPKYRLAQILLAGANFGCGSSREHAPWALVDFGIRCVIAPSFADIFYNNCFNNGVLPAIVSQTDLDLLVAEAAGDCFAVDLETQTIAAPSGVHVNFEIEPGRKAKLLGGLDDIAVTLQQEAAIRAFEGRRKAWE